MEIFIPVIGLILVFMFIKFILNKIFYLTLLLGFTFIINFTYKIPYTICLCSIGIIIYALYSIYSEIKYMGKSFIKPCRLYYHGFYEKIVTLLFSMNYIVFMIIIYSILISRSFFMFDIVEICITFALTWVFIEVVLNSRNIVFKLI